MANISRKMRLALRHCPFFSNNLAWENNRRMLLRGGLVVVVIAVDVEVVGTVDNDWTTRVGPEESMVQVVAVALVVVGCHCGGAVR